MSPITYCSIIMLLLSTVQCDNSTEAGQCGLDERPWSCLLEEWALSDSDTENHRHGRIMALPPSSGYYVTDRVDVPPPPPRQHAPHPSYGPHPHHHYPSGPNSLMTDIHSSMAGHQHSLVNGPHLSTTGQHPSEAGQHSSVTEQHPSGAGQHSSVTRQHPSGTGEHSSVTGQHLLGAGEHSSMTEQHPSGSGQHSSVTGSSSSTGQHSIEPHSFKVPMPYDEWQTSPPPPPGGKIVNRPPNPYKDKFKPSPQYQPPPYQQIPLHPPSPYPPQSYPGQYPSPPSNPMPLSDRIGEAAPTKPPQKPQKQVSETDLYLLSAIEKLVYRVDLMEKRLRKVEESLHHIVVGVDNSKKPEPCVANFSRVGSVCYHISEEPTDWKSANLWCRKLRASLLELDTETERRSLVAAMMADKRIKGMDVWTGGLNPGLLWIWSHSGRPIASNTTAGNTTSVTIVGEGRCLAMVYDPSLNNYVYRGQDCALRHRFICEKEEDKAKLSNEIERVARSLKGVGSGARRVRLLIGGGREDSDVPKEDGTK